MVTRDLTPVAGQEVRDLQRGKVAASKLAIECQVKERQVSKAVGYLQADADAPDLKRLERQLRRPERLSFPSVGRQMFSMRSSSSCWKATD